MLTSMKSLVTILPCLLVAVSAIATPEIQQRAPENELDKRSPNARTCDPLADFTAPANKGE